MKKFIALFLLSFLTFTANSQSLAETNIIGTWQVVSIVDKGNHPSEANDMIAAYFDFHADHKFQLRLKNKSNPSKKEDEAFKNVTWNFDQTSQIIKLTQDTFNIKASEKDGKMIFELIGTGILLEVVKPV
jgi:hypothetical protein